MGSSDSDDWELHGVVEASDDEETYDLGIKHKEEAQEQQTWSLWQKLFQSGLFGIAYLCMGIGLGALGPTLEPLSKMLDVSVGTMGWLFFARGIGALCGALGLGKLYDVYDPRIMFGCGVYLMGLSMAIVTFTPPFIILIVAHFILGLGVGFTDTGANAMVVMVWKGDSRLTSALQGLHFMFGVGSILIGLIAAVLSVRMAYAISAMATFVVTALQLLGLLVPELKPDMPAVPAVPGAEDTAAVASPDEVVEPSTQPGVTTWQVSRYAEIVALIATFLTAYVGIEVAFGGLIGAYGVSVLGMDKPMAAYITSLYWFSFTFGRLVAVPMAYLISEIRMMYINITGCALSMVLLMVFPSSSWAVWAAAALFGFWMAPIFPNAIAMPPYFGVILSVSSTRFLVFGASVGEMTVPWIGAASFELFGPYSLPYVMMGTLFLALLIFLALIYRFKRTPPPSNESESALQSS